jgi:hypothetical protein
MFNHRLRRKFQIANPKHQKRVSSHSRNKRTARSALKFGYRILEFPLGFGDWNLDFPTNHLLRMIDYVRELQ